jgi:hydroxylaminobenzene mutase
LKILLAKEKKMNNLKLELSRKLYRNGFLLLFLGLLTGFAIPFMANPRMGLSSHLEGTFNGMLLTLIGVVWPNLQLKEGALKWVYGLSLFGTYANWGTTFLASLWDAGGEMMPIAGGDALGTILQEGLIKFGLLSLALAMVAVCVIILWGLRGSALVNK